MSNKQFDWWKFNGHVYLIGNGGSYANAVHIANDLLGCGIRAHTLDPATLTATANDFSYEAVFSKWLTAVGDPGDLLIALSGSGRSPNILLALEVARGLGMRTWAVFGAYNHHYEYEADFVTLAGDNMQEAEEYQLAWGHAIMRRLKDQTLVDVTTATVA